MFEVVDLRGTVPGAAGTHATEAMDRPEDAARHRVDAVDVFVTSSHFALANAELPAPTVACYVSEAEAARLAERPDVLAVLPRHSLTPDQLIAAVHATAAGLRVNGPFTRRGAVSDRGRAVLRLLAGGADTREISSTLGYSERTIKASIAEVQTTLGTRNRTHAVAEAVRANLI